MRPNHDTKCFIEYLSHVIYRNSQVIWKIAKELSIDTRQPKIH